MPAYSRVINTFIDLHDTMLPIAIGEKCQIKSNQNSFINSCKYC